MASFSTFSAAAASSSLSSDHKTLCQIALIKLKKGCQIIPNRFSISAYSEEPKSELLSPRNYHGKS